MTYSILFVLSIMYIPLHPIFKVSELLYLCDRVPVQAALRHSLVTKVFKLENFAQKVLVECEKISGRSSQVNIQPKKKLVRICF